MLSDPLRKLSVLLLEIQHGVFQPDNTRSGYQTESMNGEPILQAYLQMEYELGLNLRMSRVPTDSNIADEHLRLQEDSAMC